MEKIILCYNPVAGLGNFHTCLDRILCHMQKSRIQVLPWRIQNNVQLAHDLASFSQENIHTIVAAGGDGTVHGVVNAMKQLNMEVPLGIIPIGTSNDLARNLSIPHNIEGYCSVITHGRVIPLDLGRVNDIYFINVASAGFMTDVSHGVNYKWKNLLSKGAYYLTALVRLSKKRSYRLKVSVDEQSFECNAGLFLVLNGKGAGSLPNLMPTAEFDDGRLDLLIVKDAPMVKLIDAFRKNLFGEPLDPSYVTLMQGKEFLIDSIPAMETDLDGELGPMMPWRIQTIKHAMKVRVP